MAIQQSSGKLSLLRVHDVGTKYGPPTDQLDVEVVIQLQGNNKAFGFQLRTDQNRVARKGMLDLLRDAFNHGWTTTIDYDIEPGKSNGRLFRVWLTNPSTLYFRPTIVNFGSVPLGETQVRSLTIENSAGMSVNVSFPASPAGLFKWEAFSGVLADGAERSFEMEFRPTSSAIERETLIVTSTAPGSPHSIGLIGKGLGGFPTPEVEPNGPIG